jgi:hypothetical protein
MRLCFGSVLASTSATIHRVTSDLDVFRHPFANLVNPEHAGGVDAGTQHNVPDDGVGLILALWGRTGAIGGWTAGWVPCRPGCVVLDACSPGSPCLVFIDLNRD